MGEELFRDMDEAERHAALEEAVAIRRYRSEIKRRLKSGEIGLQEVLDDPRCAKMRAHELIASLPGVGPSRAARIRLELRMQPTRRVGGLGIRQREMLAELAAKYANVNV